MTPILKDYIMLLDGGFARFFGNLLDEGGEGVAGELCAEGFDEGEAFGGGNGEVGGAFDAVEEVEVVGDDAVGCKVEAKGFEGGEIVIDPFEEYALGEDGDT